MKHIRNYVLNQPVLRLMLAVLKSTGVQCGSAYIVLRLLRPLGVLHRVTRAEGRAPGGVRVPLRPLPRAGLHLRVGPRGKVRGELSRNVPTGVCFVPSREERD